MNSELEARDVMRVGRAFAVDFYVDEDAAHDAVRDGRLFNLMHLGSGILDRAYLRRWARELTVADELASIEP